MTKEQKKTVVCMIGFGIFMAIMGVFYEVMVIEKTAIAGMVSRAIVGFLLGAVTVFADQKMFEEAKEEKKCHADKKIA